MKNIYGQVKIRLYDDKIEISTGAKNGKLTLLAIDTNYCVIKENAYTGYVHRGIGSTPTPPHIHIYIVKEIHNYKQFVEISGDRLWIQETPKDQIQKFRKLIMEQYKEETYDPLSCYSPAERKQIEEHLKRQEELMKQFNDAIDKHKEQ